MEFNWNKVAFWRENGVQCKWGKTTSGVPIMLINYKENYHPLTKTLHGGIKKQLEKGVSVKEAVDNCLFLIDIFYITAKEKDVMV